MSSPLANGALARRNLSPERIVRAAVHLADEGGIAGLSMRNLAARLKVRAMSLYNHVANKNALLDAMVEHVVADMALPRDGENWREEMRRRAVSAHQVLRRHPWSSMLIVSRVNVGPMMLRYIEATQSCLVGAGFTPEAADHARFALDSYVHGFTLQELNFPLEPSAYAEAAAAFLPNLPAERYPSMRTLAEKVITGEFDGINHLEFGLDLILQGLERLRASDDGLADYPR